MEQRKIIQNATRRNKLKSGGNDVNDTIEAEGNLQDVIELLANLRKNKEPLLHCSVFIELKARSMDALKELQSDIAMELTRSKISVDRLTLRQKEGFLSMIPTGYNQFGAQYERVLPASSVANLYPFNFSGKTDPQGLYIGRDKYGTNILVDFDRRAEDKTTSNILILGNSGQGKSYLLKLILTNIRESGKAIICLDPESEYEEEYFGGNHEATHKIAYQEIAILTPVRVLTSSKMTLPGKTWEHLNVWDCPYKMKFDAAEVSQIILRYDGMYRRCVRAKFTDFCYEGIKGDWRPIGSVLFGNASVIEFNMDAGTFETLLYVQEDTSDTKEQLEAKLDNPDEIILDRICDEVFGDG